MRYRALALNDKRLAQKYFTQGLLTLFLLVVVIILPFLYYSRGLIAGMGFAEDNAILVSWYLLMFEPIALISSINDFIMSYCISEGVEAQFYRVTYTSLAISCCLMYYLCFVCDYLIEGWMISRAVFFVLTFTGFLGIYRSQTDKETQGFVSLKEASVGYPEFF